MYSQRPRSAPAAPPAVPDADQFVNPGEVVMSLTAQEVKWVAHLARLHLTEVELETMTRQLRAIVDYVDQLKQVNTEGVEPMAHALAVHNVFREDEAAPSLPVADALANAPQRRGDFYSVPAVLD
jgi:aspartyl-tRNA(Asn)/glutamyl-tRNA(Gln) amidotransferase subunit C